jgi:hypothetical protein
MIGRSGLMAWRRRRAFGAFSALAAGQHFEGAAHGRRFCVEMIEREIGRDPRQCRAPSRSWACRSSPARPSGLRRLIRQAIIGQGESFLSFSTLCSRLRRRRNRRRLSGCWRASASLRPALSFGGQRLVDIGQCAIVLAGEVQHLCGQGIASGGTPVEASTLSSRSSASSGSPFWPCNGQIEAGIDVIGLQPQHLAIGLEALPAAAEMIEAERLDVQDLGIVGRLAGCLLEPTSASAALPWL